MADVLISGLVFLASGIVLAKAASMAVKYIVQLAKMLHLTEFVASFVLAGFVSILPEFFIAINAAFDGHTDVGIGTLIGNNIVDLTLVIGLIAIIGREIPVSKNAQIPTLPFLMAMILPVGLMLDGVLTFTDGVILVSAAFLYFAWMLSKDDIREKKNPVEWKKAAIPIAGFLGMMGIIYFSSKYVVESVVDISTIFGIPEVFAGLFLISIGTALPELTVSMQAVLSRHKSVALGDLLGNITLDATLSIGAMALITPVLIPFNTIGVSALIMIFGAILLTTYLDNDHKITRRDGVALIGLFVVFAVVQWAINGGGFAASH